MAALARRLPPRLYLGTSSWAFPGWQGLVYDRAATASQLARDGLAAYAQHPLLRTVGLDRTFYAPIAAADFATYAAAVPDDFRFLVKAHAWCTRLYVSRPGQGAARGGERNAFFLDPGYATEHVVGPCVEGLGGKAGPLLFQFSPHDVEALGGPGRFSERLHAFLVALPRGPLYAVELRNTALLTPAYQAALRRAAAAVGVCHCFNVHPSMPSIQAQRRMTPSADAPALVVRWMLHPGQRYEAAKTRYEPFDRIVDDDPGSRQAIAALCLEAAAAGRPAWVIANNKAEGSAPLTVCRLAECIVAGHAGREAEA
jgi:uncharacterized protein YecE (DUF72 family)